MDNRERDANASEGEREARRFPLGAFLLNDILIAAMLKEFFSFAINIYFFYCLL